VPLLPLVQPNEKLFFHFQIVNHNFQPLPKGSKL